MCFTERARRYRRVSVNGGAARDDEMGVRDRNWDAEWSIVEALRAGNEATFTSLVDRYYASMLSMARSYVRTKEVAEDVVQETWAAVIQGIDGFERRSSLKTWMFGILINIARTRGTKEARSTPFSSLGHDDEPVVDPNRFAGADQRWAGFWSQPPSANVPEERALSTEAMGTLRQVIAELPDAQRLVLTLRDVHDLTSGEVCDLLGISEGNQRVLLHRARSKARAAIERLGESGMAVTA
jgi:RNA polymerase sigma-70 factor (ECF subfamily)